MIRVDSNFRERECKVGENYVDYIKKQPKIYFDNYVNVEDLKKYEDKFNAIKSRAVDMKLNEEGVYVIDKKERSKKRDEEERLENWIEEYNTNYAKNGVYL